MRAKIVFLLAVLSFVSFAQFLLFDAFGPDYTAWTPEQMTTAEDLFMCIEEWWSVATPEQVQDTPQFRVVWICWEKVRQ